MNKIKEFNPTELFVNLCKWYQYDISFENERVIYTHKHHKNDFNFSAPTITDALIQWKETLEGNNADAFNEGVEEPWKDEVIFIRSLEFESKTNFQLGKMMIDMVRTEEFYKNVCFEDIRAELYENIGKHMKMNVGLEYDFYSDFKFAHTLHQGEEFYNISDETYDFIKSEVDNNLLVDYYFDDNRDRFILKKTPDMIKKVLEDNGICYGTYDSQILVETPTGDTMSIEVDDEHLYMVVFNESTSHHFDSDDGLLGYIEYYLAEDDDALEDDESEDIITGRLYLEDKEMLRLIKDKTVSILGIRFLCDNFRVEKRSYHIKDGKKISNILYHYDIHNDSSFQDHLVKDEVESKVERYVERCVDLIGMEND